jgi:betaine-aldehyde dehydrogenase
LTGPKAASILTSPSQRSVRTVPSLFIDGQWVPSADGQCSPVVNPSDATVVTEVDVATDDQVQAAIAAARRAFDRTDWSRTPTANRAALLDRVAALIDRDLEEMARLETVNTGKAMRESRWDMGDVAKVFRYFARSASSVASCASRSACVPSSRRGTTRSSS